MKRIFLLLIVFSLLLDASAQQPARPRPSQTPARPKTDRGQAISGKVVDEAGRPIFEATVQAVNVGLSGKDLKLAPLTTRSVITDENGNFSFELLSPGAYKVAVLAAGYTPAADALSENGSPKYYRPGDNLNIRMLKGGVITGSVTNQSGDPLVGVRVRALKVKDSEGRAVRGIAMGDMRMMKEWKTDDRGIYRIYGLEPGKYVVSAGSKGFNPMMGGEFDSDAPTYHPSGTRDMAAEVGVQAGQESAGIDIRYRDQKGYIISGQISNASEADSAAALAVLVLTNALTGNLENWSLASGFGAISQDGKRAFALTGIAEGEYDLSATATANVGLGGMSGTTYVAPARRIKVKGGDVTGVELKLLPLASISGQLVIEKLKADAARAACQGLRPAVPQEAVIRGRNDARTQAASQPQMAGAMAAFSINSENTPDEKGAFKIMITEASRYRLEVKLPTEDLYVQSIGLPKAAAASPAKSGGARETAKPPATGTPAETGKQLRDAARSGISIKLGESVDNVLILIGEGAAGLRGQIKAEGGALPSRLRIFLVPAEAESADNVLRYFETDMQKDGTFSLSHLPPGRYFILTRVVNEETASEEMPRPVAWDTELRQLLRTEAEAKNLLLDLQPCQRLNDYLLRFTVAAPVKKPEQKNP
jgi:hypothetical protein